MNIDLYVFIQAYMSQRQKHTKIHKFKEPFLKYTSEDCECKPSETCAGEVTVGTSIFTS